MSRYRRRYVTSIDMSHRRYVAVDIRICIEININSFYNPSKKPFKLEQNTCCSSGVVDNTIASRHCLQTNKGVCFLDLIPCISARKASVQQRKLKKERNYRSMH